MNHRRSAMPFFLYFYGSRVQQNTTQHRFQQSLDNRKKNSEGKSGARRCANVTARSARPPPSPPRAAPRGRLVRSSVPPSV
ncbi:hypothetical protein PUN28_019886 [Cardiocondyla obscurior]|uniref:Uncharacterized protein n=1 Tax=Cardiocondyla obscurior TaxID=286306 RepID=A0AAW2EDB5_9HYME